MKRWGKLFFFVAAIVLQRDVCASGRTFTPYEFDAKGDGKTNDTSAIQRALEAAANVGGGLLWIPPNGTFMIGGGLMALGHRFDGVTVQIDGVIQVMNPPAKWPDCHYVTPGFCAQAVLSVYNVDGFTLTSRSNGSFRGFLFDEHKPPRSPVGPYFLNCTNLLIENFSLLHLSGSGWIHNSQNVTWHRMLAYNRGVPEESGNLEVGGIGSHGAPWEDASGKLPWQYLVPLLRASNITIRDSHFNGGDDNICIKNDTENVLVENCSVGDGHGVTIGSTPDCNGCIGYTENITFRGIRLHGDAPLKIKTWTNTTGWIKNILFEDVTLENGASTLLSINAWYGGCRWCHQYSKPNTTCRLIKGFGGWGGACAQTENNIAIQNITVRRVRGKVINAGSIVCREPAPCSINLEDVQLDAQHGWYCANAKIESGGSMVTPAMPACRFGPHFDEVAIV